MVEEPEGFGAGCADALAGFVGTREGAFAAARFMAATAAMDAAPVWVKTLDAQAFTEGPSLEAAGAGAAQSWSFGKRWEGQNCCLHVCRTYSMTHAEADST